MPRYFSILAFIFSSVSCSVIPTDYGKIPVRLSTSLARFDDSAAPAQFAKNITLKNTAQSTQDVYLNTYRVNFGPQIVIVRASYRDDNDFKIAANDNTTATNLPGYFDLRATSALAGTSLIAEAEMASGVLSSLDGNIRPEMLRFALRNRWRDLGYGVDYQSIAKGFTNITGTVADQARDEALLWSEQSFGPFKLRGSISESWERMVDLGDVRVTRSAATALQITSARWSGSFATSYGLTGQGSAANQESTVLISKITNSFRPSDSLLLEPNFSLKEEWHQGSGARTQTPTSELSFTYSPAQSAFRLSGATSFSRIFSRNGSNDARLYGAAAIVDWKLGKLLGRNDSFSFVFNFRKQSDTIVRSNFPSGLSSVVQFKIAGF